MVRDSKAITRLSIFLSLLALLAACGDDSSDDPAPNGLVLSASQVTFNASVAGPVPAPQVVTGTVYGTISVPVIYVFIVINGTAVDPATSFSFTGPRTGDLTVYPIDPATLGVGTHTDSIEVSVCTDNMCNSHIPGSPKTVNVTYNITN